MCASPFEISFLRINQFQSTWLALLQVRIYKSYKARIFKGRAKGFAHVDFVTDAEAQDALDLDEEIEIQGRLIRVEEPNPLRVPVFDGAHALDCRYMLPWLRLVLVSLLDFLVVRWRGCHCRRGQQCRRCAAELVGIGIRGAAVIDTQSLTHVLVVQPINVQPRFSRVGV